MRPGTLHTIEVNPSLPVELTRLTELAGNLWYSWNRPARELFSRMHPQLWDAVGHNPTMFLRYVDERYLLDAARDRAFLDRYQQVLSAYDGYNADAAPRLDVPWPASGPIAYFCAEFGLHESLPIYSGGLGILAGDHCKAASDMRLPFVGVGLLYRQGYFVQTIDREGGQIVTYNDIHFTHLPATLVMSGNEELRISVDLPGRSLALRVWHVRVGHVNLYFLDSDVLPNSGEDRGITYRLYGGDRAIRLEQEIVLGIGGVRMLGALGIRPSVWHINEGHAAFMILERMRAAIVQGTPQAAALECVAGNTVFTTHTPVPAGHDQFDAAMIDRHFESYCRDTGIVLPELLALGHGSGGTGFNMTALAVHGSRFQNAVSRIHGQVTSKMLREFWPQVPHDENPIRYVTNAVHMPTFLAPEWSALFERFMGDGWFERMRGGDGAQRLLEIPDDVFWAVHQELKSQMLYLVRHRVSTQHLRNHGSEAQLARLLRHIDPADPSVLTVGFARRFATYKRAGLLFEDLQRLRAILGLDGRPVIFIFAGKAHPADEPGQEVIREIARVARSPEFGGQILLVEGYDLHVARRLVSGVDVWLNNPVYPLEASGTSGMKAGMNGVLNLSVLDGWWDEGYERGNGWAIKPVAPDLDPETRNREESAALYEILQHQVIPLYYGREAGGYARAWVQMAKQSIATLLPRFSASRMVGDYVRDFYLPAAERDRRYTASGMQLPQELATWKARARAAWPNVSISKPVESVARMPFGETLHLEVSVQMAGLDPRDLRVEFLLERSMPDAQHADGQCTHFNATGAPDGGVQRYTLDVKPEFCGHLYYFVRVYPYHELLAHRFEMGLMLWA